MSRVLEPRTAASVEGGGPSQRRLPVMGLWDSFVGGLAAGIVMLLIWAGSLALTTFDSALIGYAVAIVALTSGVIVWTKLPHPPAGATTLIVSLGILREPWQLAVLVLAVALLALQGLVINRLAGIPYPAWAPHPLDTS